MTLLLAEGPQLWAMALICGHPRLPVSCISVKFTVRERKRASRNERAVEVESIKNSDSLQSLCSGSSSGLERVLNMTYPQHNGY